MVMVVVVGENGGACLYVQRVEQEPVYTKEHESTL